MSKTILVVEDEKVLREVLVDYLRMEGYDALSSAGGEQALEIIQKDTPKLVLLDIELPDMSGIDVLKKAREQFPDLPFLILTGNQQEVTAKQAIAYGAFDYLVKPVDLEELRDKYLNQIFADFGEE